MIDKVAEYSNLEGVRVLIIEDEMLLALDLENLLEGHGCNVIGSLPDIDRALRILADDSPDVVLLDMNLKGESSAPIAAALQDRNIPFIVVTGYSDEGQREPCFKNVPVVKKPYTENVLLQTLSSVVS